MAALLYLDVDDEITSAAARIRAATDERIALVLPYGSRLATSRINFRLLAREAEAQGRALDIVAPDAAARALAAAAGLAAHPSVAAFEAAAAGLPLPSSPTGSRTGPATGAARADAPTVIVGPASAAETGSGSGSTAGSDASSGPSAAPSIRRRGASAPRGLAMPRPAATIPSVGPRLPVISPRTMAIGLAVVLVVLLAGGVAAFSLLPSATITVSPETRAVGPLKVTVTADPDVSQPDETALVIPANRFTYPASATQKFPATGIRVDEAKAGGAVTFQNCDTGGRIRIPAGAVVATAEGVEFTTNDTITVDRASVKPFDCKVKSVGVTAKLASGAANVPAGAITKVPPAFDPQVLFVANPDPTSGGKHDEFPVIQQADVDAARVALDAALAAEFDRLIADTSTLPAGTQLFPETKSLGEATPSVDPATLVGLEQADFELGLTAEGSVIGVDPAPLADLADARIRAKVDAGFHYEESSIDVKTGTPVVDSGTIRYPLTVSANETRDVDAAALLATIKGKPLHEARLALNAVGTAEIHVWPDWVTTIPTLNGRVSLTIVGAPAPSPSPLP